MSVPRDPRSRTRSTDTRLGRAVRARTYHDIWMVVITGLVFVALLKVDQTLDRQTDTRRIALNASCAATAAVIDAGRASILGGARGVSPRLAKHLQKYGYPPRRVREVAARKAADAYGTAIARRVETASGVKGLVRLKGPKAGQLDCHRLETIAIPDP